MSSTGQDESVKLQLALLLTLASLQAGPIRNGSHPNLDSQFTQTSGFDLGEQLARQFPQYSIVWQNPLVGLLSPVNPAEWVIWTPLVPAGPNPFASGFEDVAPCANRRCALAANAQSPSESPASGPSTSIPSTEQPSAKTPVDPGAAPIGTSVPEPGTAALVFLAAGLAALRTRRR